MESVANLHAMERMVLLLLVMVAAFAVMAHRLKVPYPIVLVLAGLVLSFVPHMPKIPLDPNLVFVIFLPPLLYSAAWSVSWRDFRRNLLIISLLAVGLVGFTVWGVAEFSDRFITALDWKAGFLLGAVLATTDAIAATSVAKSLGLPRRIVDILEGESLLNDATGLLALEFGLRLLERGDLPTVGAGLARLAYLIVGGLGIGLLMGVLVGWFERFVDNGPVELVLSLIVPYAAYLAAEEAKASGVLAVVACGLYLSRESARFFSPGVRIQIWSAWEAMTFVLNGIVFLLIGLQMPNVLAGIHGDYHITTLLEYGAIFSVTLIALRMIWVAPAVRLTNFARRLKGDHERISKRETFVIGWTGMRGVIALAAAVSVPEMINGVEFGARNLIIFLTFCVILVTLVLQGLTLPTVIRALGLAGSNQGMEPEEREARRLALREALTYLEEERREKGETYAHAYDDLIDRYEHRLAEITEDGSEQGASKAQVYQELLRAGRGALEAERRTIIRLRDEGAISDDVLRRMERVLDLEETKHLVH
ncbi:Na+/H+ antiporter [Edaphobacter flagellatus]|uniref:Na+/H+ antiporter n=1 Tax=Edaphobacter flagellatus TaxID=1933044 RepID=UPI0021B2BF21|nr:Na+/H+ antiporter [Edaphobacter flagellatus]